MQKNWGSLINFLGDVDDDLPKIQDGIKQLIQKNEEESQEEIDSGRNTMNDTDMTGQ